MSVLRMGRGKKEGDVRQSLGACRIEDPSLSSSLVHLSANPRVPTNQYHSLFFSIVHDVRIDSIARRRILEYEPLPFVILRTQTSHYAVHVSIGKSNDVYCYHRTAAVRGGAGGVGYLGIAPTLQTGTCQACILFKTSVGQLVLLDHLKA